MKRNLRFSAALILAGIALVLAFGSRVKTPAAEFSAAHESPWVKYVMVGLGGFRGVISEVLWIRAARLQEQGRYFEQVQLANWITALDPRAIDAWAFNAWNLTYNITAMIPDLQERVRWVEEGISLLRDRAIPANPREPRLYRELGWIYQFKFSTDYDAAVPLYREQILGGTNSPAAEAIYWARRGLEVAVPGTFDHQSLRRMVQQNSLTLAFERGEIDFIRDTIAFYDETLAMYPGERSVHDRAVESLKELLPLEAAAAALEKDAACVLVKDGAIVAQADGRGVSPILDLLDSRAEDFRGATVVDKVIGRAAAAVAIVGGAKHVYGKVMSEDAAKMLHAHEITTSTSLLVPLILNRKMDGRCPLELSVSAVPDDDPRGALEALRRKIEEFRAN